MTKVIDSSNETILQKELLPEQQESIVFYSDDSTDEYEFHDTDSIALDTKDLNEQSFIESNSKYIKIVLNIKFNNKIIDSVDLIPTNTLNENDDSSSVSSSIDFSSYFEKPLRTYSEDTILTPPIKSPSKKETIQEVAEEHEEEHITTISSPIMDRSPSQLESRQSMSTISSLSDMNEISLTDQQSSSPLAEKEEDYNPLKIITSALVSGEKPQITTVPVPTRLQTTPPPPPPKDIIYESTISPLSNQPTPPSSQRDSFDNESIASTSTTRSIFALWSPFRSSSSTNTSPASSRRPSKQNTVPIINIAPSAPRPSASFAARQTKLSRPTSIISPLPGFQDALLAQMEQLNVANTNDPKSKVIKNLKRQSIRYSLVSQNKGDDYDWGKAFFF